MVRFDLNGRWAGKVPLVVVMWRNYVQIGFRIVSAEEFVVVVVVVVT